MKEKLLTYLPLSDEDTMHLVRKDLRALGYEVLTDGLNFVFGVPPGEYVTPVLLNAHVDTVRGKKNEPVDIEVIEDSVVLNKNGILGGDDRAGITLILEVAERLKFKPYVLFTNGEETGQIGAREFVKSKVLDDHVKNIYLFIGVDRQGHCDYVTYGISIPGILSSKMRRLGYVKEYGSVSDVKVLTQEYKVAHVNVSAGYYAEHTNSEVVLMDSLNSCAARLERLCLTVDKPYIAEILPEKNYSYSGWGFTPSSNLPKPSDNNGQGTAAFEVPKDRGVYLPMPQCVLCKKDTRPTKYEVALDDCLCYVCRKKIVDNFGSISLENLAKANDLLAAEQANTRASNRAMSLRHLPKSRIPRCPMCRTNDQVEFRRDEVGFVCHRCLERSEKASLLTGKVMFTGVFYSDGEHRIWVIEDKVIRARMYQDAVVRITPLDKDKVVHKCRTCGKTGIATLRPAVHKDTGEVIYLCRDCRDEACNLGILEDTPPWEA